MSVNRFNSEGYNDPTVYKALTQIEQESKQAAFKPLVYICSPFADDTKRNVRKAQGYSRYAVNRGYIPLAPHLLFPQFMDDDDPKQRDLALFFGKVLMSKCLEVWVFGSTISPGMAAEIRKANKRRQPIRYFNEECKEITE